MKINIKQKIEIDVKTLSVQAGVRYYEDADVNGEEDTEGKLIPCKEGEIWCPDIDIETGCIMNWTAGCIADIHYKVCDQFSCQLKDNDGKVVFSIENEYVPNIMCPKSEGYGDYIIMEVDGAGLIKDWNPKLIPDLVDYYSEEN